MPRYDDIDVPATNVANTIIQQTTIANNRSSYQPSWSPRPFGGGGYGGYGGYYGGYDNQPRHTVLDDVTTTPSTSGVQVEHWFAEHWRPAMAWLYFSICLFDFILAPIFTFWFAAFTKIPYIPWHPITLEGGGLIHISLGAIIGIYTWSRTREKLANVEDGRIEQPPYRPFSQQPPTRPYTGER